jgi:hypothetical protein
MTVKAPAVLPILAALVVLAASCGGPSSPGNAPPTCTSADAIWAASDYSSSAVGSLALSGEVRSTSGVDLGGDPVLAQSGGHDFLIARDQDLVFELDPSCGTPVLRWSARPSPHTQSDPYDVAVASDGSRWVILYEAALIAIFGPDGAGPARTIDLSSYDDDGDPEASAIDIVETPAGEKAFVPLQRLGPGVLSVQPSWMLRIDVATATVETHVVLAGRNPFGVFPEAGILWLAEPGNFDDATEHDAGIERFDTATSTTALVVREPDLGGSVLQVAVSGGCGVAIVADATHNVNATSLVTFDPVHALPILPAPQSPLATPGFQLEGLTWVRNALLVGDRRRASLGYPVHALDADRSCALSPRPDGVFLPLPPVDLRAITAP